MSRNILLALLLSTATITLQAQPLFTRGIHQDSIHLQTSQKDNWCWAGILSMAFDYLNIRITQEELVQMLFERIVDEPADEKQLMTILKKIAKKYPSVEAERIDKSRYEAKAMAYTAKQHPMLVGLNMPLEEEVGHAFLLLSIEFVRNGKQEIPYMVKLIDPAKTKDKIVLVEWDDFLTRCFCIIALKRKG